MDAIIYGAKSTDDRKGSIPDQLRQAREMAEREGWVVKGEYEDEGFSAYSGNRGPGLKAALARAAELAEETGEVVMLIVQHSDRISRGAGDRPGAPRALVEIWHELRRQNVHLRSVQDDDDLRDSASVASKGKRNHDDSKRKGDSTKTGCDAKSSAGCSRGGLALPLLEIDKSSGVTVKHNHLTDFNHFNIMINDSHDITVSSNTIINGNVSAVWLVSSDRNTIDHNVITTGADVTGIRTGSVALEGSDDNQVIANTLTRTGGIVVGPPRGVEPEEEPRQPGDVSDGNTISHNRLSQGSDGVWIEAEEATHTLLLDNISAHNNSDGFEIDSPSTLVDSNIALSNAGHGFSAVPGVSSGINIALQNKTPPQCVNVRCVPRK
jgi:parallel beta-helix repeat protein